MPQIRRPNRATREGICLLFSCSLFRASAPFPGDGRHLTKSRQNCDLRHKTSAKLFVKSKANRSFCRFAHKKLQQLFRLWRDFFAHREWIRNTVNKLKHGQANAFRGFGPSDARLPNTDLANCRFQPRVRSLARARTFSNTGRTSFGSPRSEITDCSKRFAAFFGSILNCSVSASRVSALPKNSSCAGDISSTGISAREIARMCVSPDKTTARNRINSSSASESLTAGLMK